MWMCGAMALGALLVVLLTGNAFSSFRSSAAC